MTVWFGKLIHATEFFTSRSHFEIHCRLDEGKCHYEMFILNYAGLAIASVKMSS